METLTVHNMSVLTLKRRNVTTYLGGEETILSLGNLQLHRGQCQPAHVELQVLEDLVLESIFFFLNLVGI